MKDKTCPDCFSILEDPIIIPTPDYAQAKMIHRCATCFWRKVELYPGENN